jgi:hypothetical protein
MKNEDDDHYHQCDVTYLPCFPGSWSRRERDQRIWFRSRAVKAPTASYWILDSKALFFRHLKASSGIVPPRAVEQTHLISQSRPKPVIQGRTLPRCGCRFLSSLLIVCISVSIHLGIDKSFLHARHVFRPLDLVIFPFLPFPLPIVTTPPQSIRLYRAINFFDDNLFTNTVHKPKTYEVSRLGVVLLAYLS